MSGVTVRGAIYCEWPYSAWSAILRVVLQCMERYIVSGLTVRGAVYCEWPYSAWSGTL